VSDDPFVVHVARLRRVTGTRWHEVRRGPVDPDHLIAPRSPADSTVPDGAEATCDVALQPFDGGVMVTGTVRVLWQGLCRRCTVPVGGELRIAVRERFTDPGSRRGRPDSRLPEDDEAYPIVGDDLDLGPMVHDAVVLELPLAPLCRADCRGLCPHCGADRNEGSCGCVAPGDPRWANLDVLRSAR
jgi:uncharacterized protein